MYDAKIEEIYNDEFFRVNEAENRDAGAVCNLILEEFHPESVVDLGCGEGSYLKYLKNSRVPGLLGIDGSAAAIRCAPDDILVICYDLRKPLVLNLVFDVVICLEVAEHLDERYADILVENICKAGRTIVFSGATPGQTGTDHRNEQPNEYWIAKFQTKGFRLHPSSAAWRATLTASQMYAWWISKNMMVFSK